MENQILDQEQTSAQVLEYASFWERVGASLVDFLIMLPVLAFNFYNLMQIKSLVLAIIFNFIFIIYKIYMEGTFGATFGKKAMKIKVVTENFQPIDLKLALVRGCLYLLNAIVGTVSIIQVFNAAGFSDVTGFSEVSKFQNANSSSIGLILSLLILVSVIWVAFDRKKQALHDKIAKTVCVKIV
ncbi:MAG: RDD family protein [Chitinophagales bacterium]